MIHKEIYFIKFDFQSKHSALGKFKIALYRYFIGYALFSFLLNLHCNIKLLMSAINYAVSFCEKFCLSPTIKHFDASIGLKWKLILQKIFDITRNSCRVFS